MAIIWAYSPFDRQEKLEKWFDENWYVHMSWIHIELSSDYILYINGINSKIANFENTEKLKKSLKPGQTRFIKIVIFESEEDKVKFILKWM